jgi:hypothetical protein
MSRYEQFACDGVAELLNGPRGGESWRWAEDGDSVRKKLRDAELTAGDDMRRKGDIGTAAHKVLETLAEHDTVPPFTTGHDMAVISWFKATRPDVQYTEQPVFDATRGFAGMFDLQYGDETSTMLDLKTGSIRRAAVIQLNLYRIGAAACGLRLPDRLAILDTSSTGGWVELEVPIKPEWALDALAVHRNGKDIDRALRAAYKTARRSAPPVTDEIAAQIEHDSLIEDGVRVAAADAQALKDGPR